MAIEVDFSALDAAVNAFVAETTANVATSLNNIEGRVKEQSPKLTGAMAASAYHNLNGESDYEASVAAASAANPKASFDAEEITNSDANRIEGVVGVAVDYSVFVNNGYVHTSGRVMAPNPFFTRAVDSEQAALIERQERIVRRPHGQ